MKKIIAFTSALMLSCAAVGITASAEDSSETRVNVSIADAEGKIAVAHEEIAVTDVDKDNKLTINDALVLIHDAKFEGGSAAGYKSSVGNFGLAVDKLWGTENGGSYGYYVNDKAAMGLSDPISNGDHINAFVYTDTTAWSDTYSWFNSDSSSAKSGDEVTLTLSHLSYDAQFNPVTSPVEDAVITINGEATSVKTDSEGKATIKIENAGRNVVSATSDKLRLVPPVCIVNVEAAAPESTTATAETTTSAATTSAAETSQASSAVADNVTTTSPNTGDTGVGIAFAAIGVAAAAAFALRRKNEN
jgi:LPXTG-motif cell wall-anchored protein